MTILEPQTPHTRKPLKIYRLLRSVLWNPPNWLAENRFPAKRFLVCARSQSSSETIRHSGTSMRFQSLSGRGRLVFRPVSGLRSFLVRFQTNTPRYRSLRSISKIDETHQDRTCRVFGGLGEGTPSTFKVLAIAA
jgi:hypothetical protein